MVEPRRRTPRLSPGRAVGLLLAAVAAAGSLAGGCGSQGSIPPDQPVSPTGTAVAAWSQIRLATVDHLGTVLVDADGFTLYLFAPDRQGRPTCTGLCLAEWPPLVVPAGHPPPAPGPGVRQSLLGTVSGPAGAQVTYNGWPLYLWVEDQAPGQASGEDVANFGGSWYVVDAAGNARRARKGI